MEEQRWDDDRANDLLDAARVVLEAAGGWQKAEDYGPGDDPASLLRFTELYFSEGVRHRIWPHVDLMSQGIAAGDPEDLRLGVLGLLRVILCAESGPK